MGLLALITTTMPVMGRVRKILEALDLCSSLKVIVGGAPVTQDYANHIGADAYVPMATMAAKLCEYASNYKASEICSFAITSRKV